MRSGHLICGFQVISAAVEIDFSLDRGKVPSGVKYRISLILSTGFCVEVGSVTVILCRTTVSGIISFSRTTDFAMLGVISSAEYSIHCKER